MPPRAARRSLLQAFCQRLADRAVYLPLADVQPAGPGILDGSASWPFVCIDDIGRVAGDRAWEEALFALWNSLTDAGGTLLVAGQSSARETGFVLPDLTSRMAQLTAFQVRSLPENERMRALQLRARHRGLELPDETARYLLSRRRRDMASLYALLDRLDAAALRAQRRLTVPFVRNVLAD
ncbi:MAG: DnaA/Hda family protein [Woeseiaceae bacterium]|nr:DnaA/Hda family protein [Woeseiaceae bacterium]